MPVSYREITKNEQKIIDNVDMVKYYDENITKLKPKYGLRTRDGQVVKFLPMLPGKNLGICPFHKDTDASLRAWTQRQRYHCFGCGTGGSVVEIHRRIRRDFYAVNLTYEQAVQELAAMYGIELDKTDEGFKKRNPFEVARERMQAPITYRKPPGVVQLGDFRKLNNQLRRSGLPLAAQVVNYAQLDLLASLSLSNHKEG